jgi:aspartyl/asparaginyl beta-hydroxylase (cupin superfamily)
LFLILYNFFLIKLVKIIGKGSGTMHVALAQNIATSQMACLQSSTLLSINPLNLARPVVAQHRHQHISTRNAAIVCSAAHTSADLQPNDGDAEDLDLLKQQAAWDPEGILPPPTSGGHFARKLGTAGDTAGTNSVAELPRTNPSSAVAKNLLLRKTPGQTAARLPSLGQAAPPSGASNTATVGAGPVGDVIISAPTAGVGAAIDAAFSETFWGERAAPRVLDSFRRLAAGQEYVALFPGEGLQRAESYVEGLTACPFPDPYSGVYPWLEEVERQAEIIKKEFELVSADSSALSKGNNVWVPASRKDAVGYGRAWRTLVLQDRGVWDPINSKLFPKTTQLMKDVKAPTLEVFFARQQAGTGITSHTDNANFVQTSHLGLDVPEGQAWIKVGEHTKYWQNDRVIVMDTSFMHETKNESPDKDRYVLIMRHWHPELSALERIATLFLFRALDDSSAAGIRAAQKEASKEMKSLIGFGGAVSATKKVGKKGKKGAVISTGGGFGKK